MGEPARLARRAGLARVEDLVPGMAFRPVGGREFGLIGWEEVTGWPGRCRVETTGGWVLLGRREWVWVTE